MVFRVSDLQGCGDSNWNCTRSDLFAVYGRHESAVQMPNTASIPYPLKCETKSALSFCLRAFYALFLTETSCNLDHASRSSAHANLSRDPKAHERGVQPRGRGS